VFFYFKIKHSSGLCVIKEGKKDEDLMKRERKKEEIIKKDKFIFSFS
jgi:hypothetical protein